jgi:NRAMP (natural resistance-associated macrophage protein)-like metal ion transporter
MSDTPSPLGLDPNQEVERPVLHSRSGHVWHGIRVNIRGRSVTLRGLRAEPKGLLRWLLILGPGLVASSAGNDAGGIATYSSAGAQFGYDLIWVMVVITVSLSIIQEMVARLGAASGQGLLDLIRHRFGIGWAMLATGTILVANSVLIVSEFVGIGAAAELLGVSRYIAVPIAAVVLWYLVTRGTYQGVEKIFLLMTLVFFIYPVAAVLAKPDWGAVLRGAFVPTIRPENSYLVLLVGLIGTTVTPFMQLFQQSSIVERGVARRHYGPERLDAYFGAFFSNLMSITMMIATAATIYVAGPRGLASAEDAAKALEPAVGPAAVTLFAVGLLGASMLAAAVLPLATAYGVTEAFGLPKGVNLDFRRARLFFGLFTLLIILGAIFAMIPGLPVIQWLLFVQVLNGALLPVMLVFILLLINDRRLVGPLKNSLLSNILGWGTFALITTAVVVMLVKSVFGFF